MACIYNVRWRIGVVLEKNEGQLDVLIKFMYLSGPTRSLHWPDKEDLCCGFQKQRLSAQLLHHVQFLVDNTPLADMKLTKLK